MNRRFFFGLFASAVAAIIVPIARTFSFQHHPNLELRKVHIYRETQEGDFSVWRGIGGGPHPMSDVRAGDVISIVSDEADPEHGKLYRVVEIGTAENPYLEGQFALKVQEVC